MSNTFESSSNSITIGFVSVAALLVLWIGSHLLKRSIDLNGPPNPSWISGSGVEGNDKLIELEKQFLKDYGRTVKIYEPLGTEGIHTSDPMAIHSMTTKDSARYGRAGGAAVLRVVLGGGLFTMHVERFGQVPNIVFIAR
ncbi:hypothetical protein FRC12_003601 [Ceratobasidium sp. 428]|nr:hypothetical protein FRC12_003601 [Ceratobasidium sp. 428]